MIESIIKFNIKYIIIIKGNNNSKNIIENDNI